MNRTIVSGLILLGLGMNILAAGRLVAGEDPLRAIASALMGLVLVTAAIATKGEDK
jgi:hypothetical protein